MGRLFFVQWRSSPRQTDFVVRFAWVTSDTVAIIIGHLTPVLVWEIPNEKVR
jgi:hypothetical protein